MSTQVSSIGPIDRTLSGTIIPKQSGSGNDGNKGVLRIPQRSSITEASLFVLIHIQDILRRVGRGLLPLCSQCILQTQLTGQKIFLVKKSAPYTLLNTIIAVQITFRAHFKLCWNNAVLDRKFCFLVPPDCRKSASIQRNMKWTRKQIRKSLCLAIRDSLVSENISIANTQCSLIQVMIVIKNI